MCWRKLLAVGSEPSAGRFLAYCAVLGFFAGSAKAILHRNPKTTWKDILAGAVASSISALVVGSLALHALGSSKILLIMPIAGVAGWLGAALLDYLAAWAFGRVKREIKGD
jgi:hypothetical protein